MWNLFVDLMREMLAFLIRNDEPHLDNGVGSGDAAMARQPPACGDGRAVHLTHRMKKGQESVPETQPIFPRTSSRKSQKGIYYDQTIQGKTTSNSQELYGAHNVILGWCPQGTSAMQSRKVPVR